MDEMEISNQSNSKKDYEITVPAEIIEELERIQQRLMKLVDGDEDLAGNIIEYSILLGKKNPLTGYPVCRETITNLIWEKYPDIYTNPQFQGKNELFELIFQFHNIIRGQDKLTKKYLREKALDNQEEYRKYFREVIEKEIIKIFYPGDIELDESTCDIIGGMMEQLNDMDI